MKRKLIEKMVANGKMPTTAMLMFLDQMERGANVDDAYMIAVSYLINTYTMQSPYDECDIPTHDRQMADLEEVKKLFTTQKK